MNISRILFISVFLVAGIGGASAGQYDYVVPPEELWSCFDYAINYSNENPEWGMVLISDHPRFRGNGNSHFMNYQIIDNGNLLLYSDQEDFTIIMTEEWGYDPRWFMHFYINDVIPTRYYSYKLQNAEAVYNEL